MAIMAILDKNADYGHNGHTGKKNILTKIIARYRCPEIELDFF